MGIPLNALPDDETTCPIHLGSYAGTPGEVYSSPVKIIACGHYICIGCLEMHVHSNTPGSSECPLCRTRWFTPDAIVQRTNNVEADFQDAWDALQVRRERRRQTEIDIDESFDALSSLIESIPHNRRLDRSRRNLYHAYDRFMYELSDLNRRLYMREERQLGGGGGDDSGYDSNDEDSTDENESSSGGRGSLDGGDGSNEDEADTRDESRSSHGFDTRSSPSDVSMPDAPSRQPSPPDVSMRDIGDSLSRRSSPSDVSMLDIDDWDARYQGGW